MNIRNVLALVAIASAAGALPALAQEADGTLDGTTLPPAAVPGSVPFATPGYVTSAGQSALAPFYSPYGLLRGQWPLPHLDPQPHYPAHLGTGNDRFDPPFAHDVSKDTQAGTPTHEHRARQ